MNRGIVFSSAIAATLAASLAFGQIPTLDPQERIAPTGRAIEARGNTVWVGGSSAVFIYRRDARCNQAECWQLRKTLTPPAYDYTFGEEITRKRNLLVVSGGDWNVTGYGGVYIFQRESGEWVFQQRLYEEIPAFGKGHAIAGDSLVATSFYVWTSYPVGTYTYRRVASGSWESEGRLVHSAQASDGADQYAISAAMTRTNLLAGGDEHNYVAAFRNDNGQWKERQILHPWDADAYGFGRGLALRGRTAAIGAYGGSGAVYVFELRSGLFEPSQKLVRWDESDANFFAHAVAYDGRRIAAADQQSIYVFERRNGQWLPLVKLLNSGIFDESTVFDKLQFDGDYLYALSSTGVWRYDLAGIQAQ